jgi:hypothetical protein
MGINLRTKFGRNRLYYKFKKFIRIAGVLDKNEPLTEVQANVSKLAKTIITKVDADLLVTGGTIYAKWSHITIKLSQTENNIVVMNGKYYYYFTLPVSEVTEIRRRFYKSLDHRQGGWESEFSSNALKNLKTILEEVSGPVI